MPAFRVMDTFPDHPKLERLASRPRLHALAVAAWVLLGSDCLKPDRRTDGYVSFSRVKRVLPWTSAMRKLACEALLTCGLWERDGDGFRFHDWADYQATADQISADRKATANRQKRWRQKQNLARNGSDVDASADGKGNASTNGAPNGASHTVGNSPNARARMLQVQVKVPITLTTFVCDAQTRGFPTLPKTPDPEGLLRAVCDGIEKRLSARQAPAPNWTQATLTQVCTIACWLADTQAADPLAACDRLLDMWFADAWVAREGFPLGSLANHPGKYFAGRTEAPEAIGERIAAALREGNQALARSLAERANQRGGSDD